MDQKCFCSSLSLSIGSHPLTVGLVGNRIARYLYYDEKVAAMRFRVDRQNSAIQPQSLGSHGRDRKIGLVGWQLRDSDFFSVIRRKKETRMESSEIVNSTLSVITVRLLRWQYLVCWRY